ncbi:MAG: pyridoxine biosynthesis protein [Firmicutes bacterium]|nr:pyridoxine biosynthesis protein [Bacillota bacterium]
MLKGGVIMDVTTPEQAKIAEEAGACAVMALERIPADIRAVGGVSRMSDPKMIKGIQEAVSIPVMAKVRIGHFVEAQILEACEIDYIDESEVLSPADDKYHIDKTKFSVPFVCGAKDLGEALRRINEGAAMIRTKGEPGTGDIIQAVRHMRMINQQIRNLQGLREDELFYAAKELQVPYQLVQFVHENGKLPVVNFAAGGVATPADAALMMQLGAEGVFVGSGIFKSGDPAKRAQAIVKAVTNFTDAKLIAELSEDLGMKRIGVLALQGAFIEHIHALNKLGAETFEIRQKSDLAKGPIDGLVLPGGESTVMGKLLRELDLFDDIKKMIQDGLPVFGTCAGLILLAKSISNDDDSYLGTMDIVARRNAYGRQLGSFRTEADFKGIGKIDMTFIRAPFIESAGEGVDVLAVVDGKIVAARQDNQLAIAFHPELTSDLSIHKYFLENMVK